MTPKEKAQELVDSFKLFVTDEATTENGFIAGICVVAFLLLPCVLASHYANTMLGVCAFSRYDF